MVWCGNLMNAVHTVDNVTRGATAFRHSPAAEEGGAVRLMSDLAHANMHVHGLVYHSWFYFNF